MDANHDLLIQEDFWNLAGGSDTVYENLINIFKDVGNELSKLINTKFK